MKTLRFTLLVIVASFFLIGCNKQAAPGSQPAKTENANKSAAAPKPASTKKAIQPASTTATGNVYSHPEAGIQFEVPQSWKAEIDGETLTVTAPDDTISVSFWVPKEGDIETAVQALDAELGKIMTNIKSTEEAEKDTIGGMDTYSVSGTGDVQGATINWSAHLIDAVKPVYVVAFAAPGIWEQHEKELDRFVSSIRKVG